MNELTAFFSIFSRTWLKVARRPVILLLSFLQPLIWMLFFGFLFQRFPLGEMPDDVRYLDFLVPGICTMTVLIGASQSGIGLIRDMQTSFLDRMLYSPANNLAILAGKLSADVSRLMIQAAIVAFMGMLIGAKFSFNFSGLVYSTICLAIFASAYCLLSCWIALLTRKQETMASFVHLVNMPVFFTSTALVPAKQMPAWLEKVASWNPLSQVVNPLRASIIYCDSPFSSSSLIILMSFSGLIAGLTISQWNRYLQR